MATIPAVEPIHDIMEDYNEEPVKYCAKCYSLRVVYEETIDAEYCDDCGSSDILEAPIEVWEKKFENRYGHKFITVSNDPTTIMVSKMGLKELRDAVYGSNEWRRIACTLYPHFPKGFGKADSVILLFDKVLKDGRMGDLRKVLINVLNNRY